MYEYDWSSFLIIIILNTTFAVITFVYFGMPLQLFATYKELLTLRALILFRVPRAHCQLAKFQSTVNKYISISLIADCVSKILVNIINIFLQVQLQKMITGTFN